MYLCSKDPYTECYYTLSKYDIVLSFLSGVGLYVIFAGSEVPLLCSCVCDASNGSNGKLNSAQFCANYLSYSLDLVKIRPHSQ